MPVPHQPTAVPDQAAAARPPAGPVLVRPSAGPVVRSGDGVELATWDMGGDGPPLLCTHGTGFHSWMWLGAAPELALHHHVWGLDLRGHGSSGPSPDRTYRRWWSFAEDILAAVDGLGLDRPVGVGHSLGAAALLLAELLRPSTFSSLWCWEPIVPPPSAGAEGDPALAQMARRRRNHFDSVAAGVANYAGRPPFARFAPGILEAHVEHATAPDPSGGVTLVLPGPEEATCYEGAAGAGAWGRLGELDLPVTVAAGDDGMQPALWAPAVAGQIPGARFRPFPGLTHMGPAEDPPAVARAILDTTADGTVPEAGEDPARDDLVPGPGDRDQRGTGGSTGAVAPRR